MTFHIWVWFGEDLCKCIAVEKTDTILKVKEKLAASGDDWPQANEQRLQLSHQQETKVIEFSDTHKLEDCGIQPESTIYCERTDPPEPSCSDIDSSSSSSSTLMMPGARFTTSGTVDEMSLSSSLSIDDGGNVTEWVCLAKAHAD